MSEFLNSNEWGWRLLRTVVQGVLGVVVANIDLLVGVADPDPTWRAACAVPTAFIPVLLGCILLLQIACAYEYRFSN